MDSLLVLVPAAFILGLLALAAFLWALRNGHLARIAGLKLFDVFGPGEDYRDGQASLVNRMYHQIRHEGEVRLPKSRRPEIADGDQAHDFIHAKDVVAMLHSMGVKTGIDLDKLTEASRTASTFVGHELPSKYLKAHLGKQARARRQAEKLGS